MNPEDYKILLVEDEPSIARLFLYNLQKNGFKCEIAENGNIGYVKAQTYKPDLIISDIMMPECDGYMFRRKILADSELKSIPFVFLTAKGTEDDILSGYDLEIEDYIIKTASPKIIVAKIKSILNSINKEREKAVGEISKASDNMGTKVVPDEFPKFEGFNIQHWHVPFKGVPGGDFIDYLSLDKNNIAIILGDVMGKKWNAWYFAYAYAGYIRSALRLVLQSSNNYSPGEILSSVNRAVYFDERISEVFTTLSIIILNSETKNLKYSGAGDLPIIHRINLNNEVKTITSNGLLLGFSEHTNYQDIEIDLNSGDDIVLITDGITESRNAKDEMFGEERLIALLSNDNPNKMEAIKNGFSNFTNNSFEDDISLINIKVL